MPDPVFIDPDDGDPAVNAAMLIELMWKSWLALLDQYDGRDTAVIDRNENLQVQFGLHARGLLMCSIPAPNDLALGRKVIVAAWLREHGRNTWTADMVEAAIAADTAALQPVDTLPA